MLRPPKLFASLRMAVASIHATAFGAAAAADSLASTIAHAPSDDGHVSL